ncbi:Lrp/AsnC family transcriptional regulator [Streptomyces sp. NPDC057302]|uniref:Lrp/AsnC family transcriptional regulator n=1 Tax=Streptomyces sp. NPDC057302 TaxID=3346094 RepID=UPI003624F7B0
MPALDMLDISLLRELLTRPRAGMREFARTLGIARGTVHTRMGRLERLGVIADHAPRISPAQLGFPILAFVHLHLAQGQLARVTRALVLVDEVLEAHTTAGEGDLLCRVAARDTEHVEEIIQRFLQLPGVVRCRTEIALSERVPSRITSLLSLVAQDLQADETKPSGPASH